MEKSRLMLGLKLIFSLAICQFAGVVGSFFTVSQIGNWYAYLEKPFFSPPNWIFAPVWTFLYLTMGVSLFLILIQNQKAKLTREVLVYFFIQLVLNIFWSLIFFTFQSPLGGLFVIAALFIMIILTIIKFIKISEPAAFLLIPYLVWVGFASVLNVFLYFLNR